MFQINLINYTIVTYIIRDSIGFENSSCIDYKKDNFVKKDFLTLCVFFVRVKIVGIPINLLQNIYLVFFYWDTRV